MQSSKPLSARIVCLSGRRPQMLSSECAACAAAKGSHRQSSEICVRTPCSAGGNHQCCTSPLWNCRAPTRGRQGPGTPKFEYWEVRSRARPLYADSDSPQGHAKLGAVLFLAPHHKAVRRLEQAPGRRAHHQRRHQVLEHRARPRNQRGAAVRVVHNCADVVHDAQTHSSRRTSRVRVAHNYARALRRLGAPTRPAATSSERRACHSA